ncbi:hypothetical protein ACIPO9_11735 [Pseudomonas sp. NPDC090203]|jgi:hypothetical protein|uniref:hypothetical protein n=1 Tax=Pseudomonas TaxID=286 RepID=UPI0023644908|nr:hypothetical protein [Pseudomonas putida]MDD1964392.1 hypothetical protein [Pseudomonas putida]
MSLAAVMRFLGILDEKDMYMKARGGVKNLHIVGRGMLKQDLQEIYNSDSYKDAQKIAEQIVAKQA